jgi:hypothetical protein
MPDALSKLLRGIASLFAWLVLLQIFLLSFGLSAYGIQSLTGWTFGWSLAAAFPISLVPFANMISGVYGTTIAWSWPVWQGVLLFLALWVIRRLLLFAVAILEPDIVDA